MAIFSQIKKTISFTTLFILVLILFVGNYLRNYNYSTVPHPGEIADEYVFAWAGLSLIKTRIPESWTGVTNTYPSYRQEHINVDQIFDKNPARPSFSIVRPWFDKPPGFALLIGGYSYLKGAREYIETGVGIIRRPMIKIAIITTILIFILGKILFGKFVGLLAAVLFSTIPTMVISSRLALSENGYMPLMLGALILAILYIEKKKAIYWVFASILSALAILFKLSGISVAIMLALLFLHYLKGKERLRITFWSLFISFLGFLIFVLYGAIIDWNTFYKVFSAQSSLFYGTGAEVIYSLITQSKITANNFFTDGWITLGWISLIIVALSKFRKEKYSKVITIAAFSCMIVFIFFGSEAYGWYRFPFYPFLAISIAKVIEMLYKAPSIFVILFLGFLPFGTLMHKLYGIQEFQQFVPHLRLFILLTLAVFTIPYFINKTLSKKLARAYFLFILILLIYLSIKTVLFYDINNWFYVT